MPDSSIVLFVYMRRRKETEKGSFHLLAHLQNAFIGLKSRDLQLQARNTICTPTWWKDPSYFEPSVDAVTKNWYPKPDPKSNQSRLMWNMGILTSCCSFLFLFGFFVLIYFYLQGRNLPSTVSRLGRKGLPPCLLLVAGTQVHYPSAAASQLISKQVGLDIEVQLGSGQSVAN